MFNTFMENGGEWLVSYGCFSVVVMTVAALCEGVKWLATRRQ